MKIGFAGAGAIGCHYGSKLQQAGFDVLLLARGEHLKALQSNGLTHESEGVSNTISVHASGDASQLRYCQTIFISCKMTGLHDLITFIQPHIQTGALLVSLQNGVEAPDLIASAFPEHTLVAGTAFIGARLERPGHVIHSAAGGVRLGLWQYRKTEKTALAQLSSLVQALQSASIPARIDTDPATMLWRKLLWNCGFNAITAITRCYACSMVEQAETLSIVQQAMQETLILAQAQAIDIHQHDIDKHIETTLNMGSVKTSMWQDIEAGHRTEVDYINGYVADQSEKRGLSAPTNRMLSTLIHAIEKSSSAYDKGCGGPTK